MGAVSQRALYGGPHPLSASQNNSPQQGHVPRQSIGWLRGTAADEWANRGWEQLYDSVPVFKQLSADVGSRNTKKQRRGGVCGRVLRGYPRASTKEAPFQNGATRRAGTRGCC